LSKFLILAFLFFAGCVIGWGIEVFFRRFVTNREYKIWVNPGFLIGPYLPLYGFGLCILYLMAGLEKYFTSKFLLFVIMAVLMTALEYVSGLLFIKTLHIKLWDYSNRKFNIQGIICPLFSFFWAILGAVYYFFIHPYILNALEWFSQNLAFSFIIGMFYGVFCIDLGYSIHILTKIEKFVYEKKVIIKYELLKQQVRERAREQKEKLPFFVMIKSPSQVREHLIKYLEIESAFHDMK